jgi:hypothetical protein
MSLEEEKSIIWKNDGLNVPFDSFCEFANRQGFKHIFSSPFGDNPQKAVAARTLEELNRIIDPIEGISGFDFN